MAERSGRLKDKVALVIGAGAIAPGWGNGRATATLFAREGAKVFGVDLSTEALTGTSESIEAGAFEPHVADVTDPDQVKQLVDACVARFGRIDVLVNNVGGSVPGDPVDMAHDAWTQQLDYNLTYVFNSSKHVIPIMVEQGGGAIVNLGSIAALRYFGTDVAGYAAAKAGLVHFSRVTAVKYAPQNVRINTVVPGLMNTPLVAARLAGQRTGGDVEKIIAARHRQVPMGHMGDGWDVAHAVLFLASDEARYITATELVVDGGLSASCVAPHPGS